MEVETLYGAVIHKPVASSSLRVGRSMCDTPYKGSLVLVEGFSSMSKAGQIRATSKGEPSSSEDALN